MNNNFSIKKIVVFIAVAVILLISSIAYRANSSENIDALPEDGLIVDTGEQAVIKSEDGLLSLLGSTDSYDALSRDLYMFAKTGYEKYSPNRQVIIGFKTLKVTSKDSQIYIEGRFGATKNKIVVVVKPLNHGKITVSITDSKTGLNIDNSLLSNTKRNQFIGTLPLEKPNYVIDYIEETDALTANVFNGVRNYDEVQAVLKEGLGVESLESENIIYYGVGTGGYNNDY